MNERKQFIAEHPFLVGTFIGLMVCNIVTVLSFFLYMMLTIGSLV